jgi:hypothetical protein
VLELPARGVRVSEFCSLGEPLVVLLRWERRVVLLDALSYLLSVGEHPPRGCGGLMLLQLHARNAT